MREPEKQLEPETVNAVAELYLEEVEIEKKQLSMFIVLDVDTFNEERLREEVRDYKAVAE